MKRIALILIGLFILVSNSKAVEGQDSKTFLKEKYRIELSLPERWTVEYPEEVDEQNTQVIIKAKDKEKKVNIELFLRPEKWRKYLAEWMDDRRIPEGLGTYSKGQRYSVKKRRHKKIVESGKKIQVEYLTLSVGGQIGEVAFAYFSHSVGSSGYYMYLFVYNTETQSPLDKELEEIIIPGLNFF